MSACIEEQPDHSPEQASESSPSSGSAASPRRFGRRALARAGIALAGLIGVELIHPADAPAKKKKKKKCASGLTACGTKCVDRKTDGANCGSCGKRCPGGTSCVNGSCRCTDATKSLCNGACVNLQTSNGNCGSCGKTCTGETTCITGSCRCADNLAKCGDKCFNLQTNENNCGACGNVCTGELTCINGACDCPTAGESKCGDTCFNLQTNSNHCGTCSTVCTGELTCVSGTCGCTGGKSACGTTCFDLQTDQQNCGDCGTVCDPDVSDTCSGGSCNCGANPGCTGAGVYCVNSQCVDLNVCSACTFTTVQAAVDAAPEGATIPIAAGTYEGLITIDKNLTLAGAGKAATILTCTDSDYGVGLIGPILKVNLGKTVTIQDLKITGGKHIGQYTYGTGGGVWNQGDLTLDGCDISSNEAKYMGGGIYSGYTGESPSLTLIDTDVKSNTCSVATGQYGGGIYTDGPLSITGGTISGNSVPSVSGQAGGIYCNGTMTASGVVISNNTSTIAAGGLQLRNVSSTAGMTWSLTDCDIDQNSCTGTTSGGGGIYAEGGNAGATLTISGASTIRRNSVSSVGAGIYILTGCVASLNGTSSVTLNSTTGSPGYGGGVNIDRSGSTAILTMNDSSEISGNTVACATTCGGAGGGGGVYVDGSGDGFYGRLIMNGTSKIQNNTATNLPGGGIRSNGKVALSPNCLVSGNTAQEGGGISSGSLFVSQDRLTGVTATNVTGNSPDQVKEI